jgi:hypothetical protein
VMRMAGDIVGLGVHGPGLGADDAHASAAVLGLRLEFEEEHELELCIEARFYYAPPVPLRRELNRCPDAQPVPRRAAASFNQRVETNRRPTSWFTSGRENLNIYSACVSALSAAVAHPSR